MWLHCPQWFPHEQAIVGVDIAGTVDTDKSTYPVYTNTEVDERVHRVLLMHSEPRMLVQSSAVLL